MPTKHLQQDVQVRWNSTQYTQYMMQSLLEQQRPLSVYAADHNLPVNQWRPTEETVEALAPFEELTRVVSSDISCCSCHNGP